MRKSLFAIMLLALCALVSAQQKLDNDTVIKMVKAGLSDDIVIATLNSSPGTYDTTPDGLIALRQAGVSDRVITAIMSKAPAASQAQTPPQASSQSPATRASDAAPPPPAGAAPAAAVDTPEAGTAVGSKPISAGSRIVIAPMGGFETYFAAAVREKKVPVTLTLDKASAQFFVVSTDTEWEGFVFGSGGSSNWSPTGGSSSHAAAASSTRGLEASIMLIDAKTKDVIWAYEVHKNSHGSLFFGTLGARGKQSVAEACAKHLKEYIETGK
jgi:hypothetical protein